MSASDSYLVQSSDTGISERRLRRTKEQLQHCNDKMTMRKQITNFSLYQANFLTAEKFSVQAFCLKSVDKCKLPETAGASSRAVQLGMFTMAEAAS